MTVEDILDETGGFGRFQLLLVMCICLNRLTLGWSMLQMAFAGFIPDWQCHSQNSSMKDCSWNNISDLHTSVDLGCEKYDFDEPPLTIINQWGLVCGLSWVRATVTSIQMAGVLVGVIIAEKLGDLTGRKKIMYLFVLEHAILNLVAAFSVSWHMFTVCRFFIGLGIGVIICCSVPYPLEFLPLKWRPMVNVLPIWSIGIAVFALAGWLMENWSHLHIACGVLSFPALLGYFLVPESLKWLTSHDQMKEAAVVVTKIALVNRKVEFRKASIMLQTVAWEEQKGQETNTLSTYLDTFKQWKTAKLSLTLNYHWFSLSLVYYGICLNVSSLTGNIYLNIFILALVELPTIFITSLSGKIGRKWSSATSLVVACLSATGCVLVHHYGPDDSKGVLVTILCLTVKLTAGAAWSVVVTWAAELRSSVPRSHGLATADLSACVGALVSPFVIDLDNMAFVSFIVMSCLLFINIILCFLTSEIKAQKNAETSISMSVVTQQHIHRIDLDNDHDLESHSSTDATDSSRSSHNVGETTLGVIDEETSSMSTDQNPPDTCQEISTGIATADITLSAETKDSTIDFSKIGQKDPDIKNDKISKKDKDSKISTRKRHTTLTPKESPEPKPRKKKQIKLKNVDFLQGKAEPKPKDESPPYIESDYHKKIRYSIY